MYLHVICVRLSQTVVHSFHALELKIAMRPVRSGKGREGSIHKMIRPMKNLQKILRYFLLLLLVCQTWPEQDSAEMIQDSPWQCQHIVYFVKDKILLLIGSNDQTHLIDPNSLSDMNYHDCFDSFVYFLLPVTTIYNRQKHCQQHRHRHQEVDFKHLFPGPLFPVAKVDEFFAFRWFWNLGKDVALAQKNQYIHSPSMTTLQQLSFKSEKLKPKIMPHS